MPVERYFNLTESAQIESCGQSIAMSNYREKDEISKYVANELERIGYRKVIDDIGIAIRKGAKFPIRKGVDVNHVQHVMHSLAYEDGETRYLYENIDLCCSIAKLNVFQKSTLALKIQMYYLGFIIELIDYNDRFTRESVKSAETVERILRSRPEVLEVIDKILFGTERLDTVSILPAVMQAIETLKGLVEKDEVLSDTSRHMGRPKATKSMLVIDVWETLSGYGVSKRAVARLVGNFLARTDVVPSTTRLSNSLYQTIRNHEVNR